MVQGWHGGGGGALGSGRAGPVAGVGVGAVVGVGVGAVAGLWPGPAGAAVVVGRRGLGSSRGRLRWSLGRARLPGPGGGCVVARAREASDSRKRLRWRTAFGWRGPRDGAPALVVGVDGGAPPPAVGLGGGALPPGKGIGGGPLPPGCRPRCRRTAPDGRRRPWCAHCPTGGALAVVGRIAPGWGFGRRRCAHQVGAWALVGAPPRWGFGRGGRTPRVGPTPAAAAPGVWHGSPPPPGGRRRGTSGRPRR